MDLFDLRPYHRELLLDCFNAFLTPRIVGSGEPVGDEQTPLHCHRVEVAIADGAGSGRRPPERILGSLDVAGRRFQVDDGDACDGHHKERHQDCARLSPSFPDERQDVASRAHPAKNAHDSRDSTKSTDPKGASIASSSHGSRLHYWPCAHMRRDAPSQRPSNVHGHAAQPEVPARLSAALLGLLRRHMTGVCPVCHNRQLDGCQLRLSAVSPTVSQHPAATMKPTEPPNASPRSLAPVTRSCE